MANGDTVSGETINQNIKIEGAYFSEFLHENYSPTHTVEQQAISYSSPYGDFSVAETIKYIANSNHTVESYNYTVKEGSNTFTYSDHYTANASGGYNVVEKSTFNGVTGPVYHYNSNAA